MKYIPLFPAWKKESTVTSYIYIEPSIEKTESIQNSIYNSQIKPEQEQNFLNVQMPQLPQRETSNIFSIDNYSDFYLRKIIREEFQILMLPYQQDIYCNIGALDNKIQILTNQNNPYQNPIEINPFSIMQEKSYKLTKEELDIRIGEMNKKIDDIFNFVNTKSNSKEANISSNIISENAKEIEEIKKKYSELEEEIYSIKSKVNFDILSKIDLKELQKIKFSEINNTNAKKDKDIKSIKNDIEEINNTLKLLENKKKLSDSIAIPEEIQVNPSNQIDENLLNQIKNVDFDELAKINFKEINANNNKIKSIDVSNANLSKRISQLESRLVSSDSKITQIQNKIKEYDNKINQCNSKTNEIENKFKECNNKFDLSNSKLSKIEESLENITKMKIGSSNIEEKSPLESSIKELNEKLKNNEDNINQMQIKINALELTTGKTNNESEIIKIMTGKLSSYCLKSEFESFDKRLKELNDKINNKSNDSQKPKPKESYETNFQINNSDNNPLFTTSRRIPQKKNNPDAVIESKYSLRSQFNETNYNPSYAYKKNNTFDIGTLGNTINTQKDFYKADIFRKEEPAFKKEDNIEKISNKEGLDLDEDFDDVFDDI